jgi:hypothetical protein
MNINGKNQSQSQSQSKSPLPPFYKGGVFKASRGNRIAGSASPFEKGGLRGIRSSALANSISTTASRRRLLPASSACLAHFDA